MVLQSNVWILMLAVSGMLCGCIGTTEAGPYDSYAPENNPGTPHEPQRTSAKVVRHCEPPEATTGDLAATSSMPCGAAEYANGERTREPPEIHPN